MKAFSNLPCDNRMAFLDSVCAAGGDWTSYSGAYVNVIVPHVNIAPCPDNTISRSIRGSADGLALMDMIAEHHGLTRDTDPYYFPLCSDRLPEHQQHDGPAYCGYGRLGYRFIASYRPAEHTAHQTGEKE